MIERLVSISLAALVLCSLSCNKTNDFGSFLENESALPISFAEVPITAHTVRGDSVLSWSEFQRPSSYVAGTLTDPYFGTARAEIYWQLNLAIPPDFDNITIDSMILSLDYDTARVGYGSYLEPQDFEINRLIEPMVRTEDIFSDRQFMVEMDPIGTIEEVVPNKDTTFVDEPRALFEVVTNRYGPQMRVNMSKSFAIAYTNFGDSIFDSNISFQRHFMGMHLNPLSETGGMINFLVPDSRLATYYSRGDTMYLYEMELSTQSVVHNYLSTDMSGSLAEEYILNESTNDSLLFVQALGGPEVEITVTDLSGLQGATINNAELEFIVATLDPQDSILFPPTSQMGLYELQDDGEQELVKDLEDVIRTTNLTRFFQGNLIFDSDIGKYKYILNISQHMQRIVDGEASNVMILTTLQPVGEASRSIIYGPSHSEYGAKLRVTHTKF